MASSDDTSGSPERPAGREGDAIDALTPALYAELRRLAAGYLRRERTGHTLQPTALVHEAYLRLMRQHNVSWTNREQVLGVAAHLMRLVLVDYARSRGRAKRAGLETRVTFDGVEADRARAAERPIDLVALDDAMRELAEADEQACRIVEMRYFAGMTVPEIAEVLAISPRSVDRSWSMARAWLRGRLEGKGGAA